MRKILILVLCLFTLNINAQVDLMSTTPTNFVNDFEDIFSTTDEQMLNSMIKSYKDKTSVEICVVTTDEIFDSEAELKDFSDRLGEKWGVGSSELDNGIMVLISLASRKWSISVGYGLEGLYTDMMSKRLAERHLKPNFRNENYAEGVKQFLIATMDEIGYEGYEQLIEKERIRKEEAEKQMKEFGVAFLFVVMGVLFIALIVYLIRMAIKKAKARQELSNEIDFIHEDILLREAKLVEILNKVPAEIQKVYDDNITNNKIKVDQNTLNRLLLVQSTIKDFQNVIYNTNSVISAILSEEREVKKYLEGNYEYCQEYLLEDLKSFVPDTRTEIFTTTDFSVDRLNKLRNLNNSLSGKLKRFLNKTYTISAIVSAHRELDDKVKELEGSYAQYKEGKKILMDLPIGKRFSDLAKIDIEQYISNVKGETNNSILKLKGDDYEGASYHHGISVTTLSVLASTFGAVTSLISSYKRSDKYVKEHKNDFNDKITNVENKISKSGVKHSRKDTLEQIRAKIKKFNNNVEFDIILSAILLKEILDGLDKLYDDIKDDIKRKKDSDARVAAATAAAAAAASRRRSSSSGSGFGGYGGGSFGGGGSTGSW